jgi:hypothetical protein
MEKVPVPVADGETGEAFRNRIGELVGRNRSITEEAARATTPHEQVAYERQVAALDAQIDKEFYAFFNLTEEEIQIVESAN